MESESKSAYTRIDKPEASTCAKIIRGFNLLAAGLIVAFGIVGLVFMIMHDVISKKFFLVFSPVFIVLFGLVMIAVEFKVAIVMETFDFLGTLLGKGIFYIYLSSEVFFFFTCGYEEVALAWVSAMIIFGLGIVFLCLNFCSSDYNDEVRERLN